MSEAARKEPKAVAKIETADVATVPSQPTPILSMLQRIMTDPALPMERVNQAFDFYQRVRADEAQRAYYEAKAAFKAVAPAITKDKENKQYKSTYASIGNVVNVANEALSKHGLDASWTYDQGEQIKVTCTLRHVLGHAECVSLSAPPDVSGAKNPLQQIKSTLTYLKLATYEAVTGIATKEGNADDDGNAAGTATVSAEQLGQLQSAIDDTSADVGKFCRYFKIDAIGALPAARFTEAMTLLEGKKRAQI